MINDGIISHSDFETKFMRMSNKNKDLVLKFFKKISKVVK